MLIEVAGRRYHAWSVHLEGIREGPAVSNECSVRSQSDEPMHQGDKVNRTVRRLLFMTRATGAARDEQLGEHKIFLQGLAMEIFASSDRTRCWMC